MGDTVWTGGKKHWAGKRTVRRTICWIFMCLSSRIFENVAAKWIFCVQQLIFGHLQVAIIKLRVQPLLFSLLLLSSSSLFLFSFSFLFSRCCDFGANRAQETCLVTHFHSNDGKKSARYTCVYIAFIYFSWVALFLYACIFYSWLFVLLLPCNVFSYQFKRTYCSFPTV